MQALQEMQGLHYGTPLGGAEISWLYYFFYYNFIVDFIVEKLSCKIKCDKG